MPNSFKQLDIDALDAAAQARPGSVRRPPTGWVRALREALGMTRSQLGERTGIAEETVNTLERNEARGAITLASLEKLAAGMGARVEYVLVPVEAESFDSIVRRQAERVARERLARVSHSMALEDQALDSGAAQRQFDRLVHALLSGSRRLLWKKR
jgi:predicted DNA-binding mobile mystery protein A